MTEDAPHFRDLARWWRDFADLGDSEQRAGRHRLADDFDRHAAALEQAAGAEPVVRRG